MSSNRDVDVSAPVFKRVPSVKVLVPELLSAMGEAHPDIFAGYVFLPAGRDVTGTLVALFVTDGATVRQSRMFLTQEPLDQNDFNDLLGQSGMTVSRCNIVEVLALMTRLLTSGNLDQPNQDVLKFLAQPHFGGLDFLLAMCRGAYEIKPVEAKPITRVPVRRASAFSSVVPDPELKEDPILFSFLREQEYRDQLVEIRHWWRQHGNVMGHRRAPTVGIGGYKFTVADIKRYVNSSSNSILKHTTEATILKVLTQPIAVVANMRLGDDLRILIRSIHDAMLEVLTK